LIDIDVGSIYEKAHGEQMDMKAASDDPFKCVDLVDAMMVRNVCQKTVELEHAMENLLAAIRGTRDCVRFTFGTRRCRDGRKYDLWSEIAIAAATYDGIRNPGDRSVYLRSDDDSKSFSVECVTSSIQDAYDTSEYARNLVASL